MQEKKDSWKFGKNLGPLQDEKYTPTANTDNKVHKLVMVFANYSQYLDSEPVTV
jgi:hypothetical protein